MNMNIEQYCGAVTSARLAFRLVNQKSNHSQPVFRLPN